MAHQHVETNPHFIDPEEITPEQHDYLPSTLLPRRGHDHRIPHRTPSSRVPQDQRPQRQPRHPQGERERPLPFGPSPTQPHLEPRHPQGERPQPLGPSPTQPHHEGEPHLPIHVWVPPVHHEEGQHPSSQQPPHDRQGQQRQHQPLGMWLPPPGPPRSSIQGPASKKQKRKSKPPKGAVMVEPQLQDQHPSASLIKPQDESTPHHPSPAPGVITPQHHGHGPSQGQGRHPHEHRPHTSLFLPRDRRTKPLTWFAAAFCIVFWLVIIIGGLIVLIVYLLFRPRSPRFDVNGVTLNVAYLDMGYLLNADLSLLANFTNPNKKVRVDFSYMYLDLYFENSMIATQYIEPFSAERGQSMFANIHMVTSQVRLSMKETMLLQKQIQNNRVMLTVKGRFRARSNLGSFLKYSYWLHGQCSIMVSSPPTGVLKQKYCRTKR